MHSSYQHHETHYGDLSLPVHERIEKLSRQAAGLAPRVADSALDSGCTGQRPGGPRQAKAWDMIAEAHGWNAVSDDPETLNEAERRERDGAGYRVEYGPAGFQVVLEPKAQLGASGAATETVPTSALRVGDVVLTHGMRVRIDQVSPYRSHTGADAWSCPGTVLNLAEVLAAKIVPASFLTTEGWQDGRGWVTGRNDYWAIQGNDLARWIVERPEPRAGTEPDACPVHGWRDCLCSGAPDYRVRPALVNDEPLDCIAGEDSPSQSPSPRPEAEA